MNRRIVSLLLPPNNLLAPPQQTKHIIVRPLDQDQEERNDMSVRTAGERIRRQAHRMHTLSLTRPWHLEPWAR
ncbi:unnamed protein product [Ectocarpus sp. CCAP 1310/34]|nr:unnamed protein product [Ectocarpus sp. CCAP 1310/34]